MNTIHRDVVIIGAGASGLMCAAVCGKRGRSVTVLDHAPRIAGKVLVSGGGRSNFANTGADCGLYLSENPDFCKSALARFGADDFTEMLRRRRIGYHEEDNGRLFLDRTSRELVHLLRRECDEAGVEIRLNCRIDGVGKDKGFVVKTSQGTFRSASLVVATGGLSFPQLGATGIGHRIARNFGLEVTSLRPGLVPFRFGPGNHELFRHLSGISVNAALSCAKRTFRGSILFTHQGLSGPAVLQVSLYWKERETVIIDLLPDENTEALLIERHGSNVEMRNFLAGFFPKRFAEKWSALSGGSRPMNRYSLRELKDIAGRLHNWQLVPEGTEGYKKAEVTVGGVDTKGLSSKTMESVKVPGLYFVGEVVDITGQLGGLNLQWAWASGHAAGQYA
jgi:predicted Rossmann fold flavoprotein